jgi:hypothetical protein
MLALMFQELVFWVFSVKKLDLLKSFCQREILIDRE